MTLVSNCTVDYEHNFNSLNDLKLWNGFPHPGQNENMVPKQLVSSHPVCFLVLSLESWISNGGNSNVDSATVNLGSADLMRWDEMRSWVE